MIESTINPLFELVFNFSWPEIPQILPDREWHNPAFELGLVWVTMVITFSVLVYTKPKNPIHPKHPDYKKQTIFCLLISFYKSFREFLKKLAIKTYKKLYKFFWNFFYYVYKFFRIFLKKNLRKLYFKLRNFFNYYYMNILSWFNENKNKLIQDVLKMYINRFCAKVINFKNELKQECVSYTQSESGKQVYSALFGTKSYTSKHLNSHWIPFMFMSEITVNLFIDTLLKGINNFPEGHPFKDMDIGAFDQSLMLQGIIFLGLSVMIVSYIEGNYQKRGENGENIGRPKFTFLKKKNKKKKK